MALGTSGAVAGRARDGRRDWGTGRGRPAVRLAAGTGGGRGGGGRPAASAGDPGWYFTDFVPPPLTGRVGSIPITLRIWPPDVIPTHSEAFRVRTGVLRGFWVVVGFP